jgi:pimeloyl-ACP methyl ester carboxylesterase
VSTFVLIPGAGGSGKWYWQRVVPLLERAGHTAIPVDLPGPDPAAGLPEYAALVTEAAAGHEDVVLVAQSLGGFTAPMAAERTGASSVVLVNAMIPVPGETPGAWWEDTGWERARCTAAENGGYPAEFDENVYFLHDVPADIRPTASGQHDEAGAVFGTPCTFAGWPGQVRVLAGADDRFFPTEFQLAVALDRLGIQADVLPGGHLNALSQPEALAGYLTA